MKPIETESERVQKGRTMAGTTNVVGRRRRLAVVTISRAAVEPGTTTDVVKPIRIESATPYAKCSELNP